MRFTTIEAERPDHTGITQHVADPSRAVPVGTAGVTYCGEDIENDDAYLVVRNRPVTCVKQVNCDACLDAIEREVVKLLAAMGRHDAAADLA